MAMSEHFIGPLRKTVARSPPSSLTAMSSDIVVRDWSDGNWVRGAAAMTLSDLYGAPWGTDRTRASSGAAASANGELLMNCVGVGVIGCGEHQRRLSDRGEELSDPRHCRAFRTPILPRREARAARIWAHGAVCGSKLLARSGGRDRPQPHGAEGARRGRIEGGCGRQACPLGEAPRSQPRGGTPAWPRPPPPSGFAWAARRHVPRGRASDRPAMR